MKLISNWRSAWKWFSVQAMGLASVLLLAWAAVPEDLKSGLPPSVGTGLVVLILFCGIVGRLVDQEPKH